MLVPHVSPLGLVAGLSLMYSDLRIVLWTFLVDWESKANLNSSHLEVILIHRGKEITITSLCHHMCTRVCLVSWRCLRYGIHEWGTSIFLTNYIYHIMVSRVTCCHVQAFDLDAQWCET